MAASATATLLAPHISATPGVLAGKPCIAGHRISVWMIYEWHELGHQSVDEILERFPQLNRAEIYGALSYAWDHLDDYRAYVKRGDELIESLKREQPSKVICIEFDDDDSFSP